MPTKDGGARRSGRGPQYFARLSFVFFGNITIYRLYELTLSEQAQVSLQLTVSLFRFRAKIFSRSSPGEGPEKKKTFSSGPKPALADPEELTFRYTLRVVYGMTETRTSL